jgi:hypothetical protein
MEIVQKIYDRFNLSLKYLMHKGDKPVIVTGLGRCGTTLLKDSIKITRGYESVFSADLKMKKLKNGTFI